jgi:hypothetical protein
MRRFATANSWMVAALNGMSRRLALVLALVVELVVVVAIGLAVECPPHGMSGVDHWMALPPPCGSGGGSTGTDNHNATDNAATSAAARIMHVFCDPTGCHATRSRAPATEKRSVLPSFHSSLEPKLPGLGRNPDGTKQR